MSRKKVLVIFPGALLPVSGMSQVRTIEQIKRLSRDFEVDLLMFGTRDHNHELKEYCRHIHNLSSVNKKYGVFSRILWRIISRFSEKFFSISRDYLFYANSFIQKQLLKTIKPFGYDIIISHYWYVCGFFEKLSSDTVKVIDTHYVVEENLELAEKNLYENIDNEKRLKVLKHSLRKQAEMFRRSDLLVFNSARQKDIVEEKKLNTDLLLVTNGQELDKYLNYSAELSKSNTILFYGALGNQFNQIAIRNLISDILPIIKKEVEDIRLIIVGSSAPDWLKEKHDGKDIVVTGFVEDIKPYLSSSHLTIMPLRTASGFRGRTVELMALGVPIIGTHNALDSVGIKHMAEGYISNDNTEMAQYAINLLKNPELRKQVSEAAKIFVSRNYTIEATFGKLSSYLLSNYVKDE